MKTPKHTARIRFHREDGQAFVEFAIVLPILVLLVFGITQFGLAFHNYLAITDAARVGARAAAVKRTAGACTAARTAIQNTVSTASGPRSRAASPAPPARTRAIRSRSPIKYPYAIGLPGFSASGNLTANATERME